MKSALLALLALSCGKVPLVSVDARFELADATWFEAEQTLFVFYDVRAEQGLNSISDIEIRYNTDDERVEWTPLDTLPAVHTHVPIEAGPKILQGSWSVAIPLEPRNVELRLRYHPDGSLALDSDTIFNVVDVGPAHTNRSLLVYGVFGEDNATIQWRSRHVFPTLRNERVSELGLRRFLEVDGTRFGAVGAADRGNPYAYGEVCPDTFVDAGFAPLSTTNRARFEPDPLPIDAEPESGACGEATVTDALGTFTTGAFVRKNPEVRAAFPLLRSPVEEATPLKFFLAPCLRTFDEPHEAMQRQRLQMEDTPTTCTEGWQQDGFVGQLVLAFRNAIEANRPDNNDMVLVVGIHRDEPGLAAVVEEALALVVPIERHRATPRVAGAFVFDSDRRGLQDDRLTPNTLWCPSTLDGDNASARTCAITPINQTFSLGPITASELPILASRTRYADFRETYSEAQAGEVEALRYKAPRFATTSDHEDFGVFGVVTFLNGESISADSDDAFSFCESDEIQAVAFRSEGTQLVDDPGIFPLSELPAWHNAVRESDYDLGLFWDFPYLLELDYRVVSAAAISAAGFTVPFGIASQEEAFYGTALWTEDAFPLDQQLKQCTRWCNHPTFDNAGVYQVRQRFRATYERACYLPRFPVRGEGFPRDP